jgi:hypothetical protein
VRYTRTQRGNAHVATTLRSASLVFVAKEGRTLSIDSIAKSLGVRAFLLLVTVRR